MCEKPRKINGHILLRPKSFLMKQAAEWAKDSFLNWVPSSKCLLFSNSSTLLKAHLFCFRFKSASSFCSCCYDVFSADVAEQYFQKSLDKLKDAEGAGKAKFLSIQDEYCHFLQVSGQEEVSEFGLQLTIFTWAAQLLCKGPLNSFILQASSRCLLCARHMTSQVATVWQLPDPCSDAPPTRKGIQRPCLLQPEPRAEMPLGQSVLLIEQDRGWSVALPTPLPTTLCPPNVATLLVLTLCTTPYSSLILSPLTHPLWVPAAVGQGGLGLRTVPGMSKGHPRGSYSLHLGSNPAPTGR